MFHFVTIPVVSAKGVEPPFERQIIDSSDLGKPKHTDKSRLENMHAARGISLVFAIKYLTNQSDKKYGSKPLIFKTKPLYGDQSLNTQTASTQAYLNPHDFYFANGWDERGKID